MAATHDTHHPPAAARSAAALVGLFWFLLTAGLALTASLVVLGGSRIIAGGTVRIVLVTALVTFVAHSWAQFRRRREPIGDERILRAKERRGF